MQELDALKDSKGQPPKAITGIFTNNNKLWTWQQQTLNDHNLALDYKTTEIYPLSHVTLQLLFQV